MSLRFVARALPVLVSVVIFVGCIEREGVAISPCTNRIITREIHMTNVDAVDLLFMVDNSGSMREEQESLTDQFPRMINILASGDFDQDGDLAGDGEEDDPDFRPVRSLHVGVITSDMGVGGYDVRGGSCTRPDFGDDGTLRTEGQTGVAGCMAMYPSFLAFEPASGESAADFAASVSCVATVGTAGCGVEQQLEAILKALSPAAATDWTASDYVAPTFHGGTMGHGADGNMGFIRESSVLAIIPVTDEDDCSMSDPRIFDPTNTSVMSTHENLRCFANRTTALHGISRYVDGFLALRQNPGHLIYAPITGIPIDLAPAAGQRIRWDQLVGDRMIRDDRMEEMVDPINQDRLAASCSVEGRGLAFPPLRVTQVAQQLQARGAGVTVQSICQESFETALTEIISLVRHALGNVCLPREINRELDGRVACEVITVMPESMTCDGIEGLSPRLEDGTPVVAGTRRVCVMHQVVPDDRTTGASPPTEPGWYYDDFTDEGRAACRGDRWQRIGFTVQPPGGADVQLECFQSVPQGAVGEVHIGTFCDPTADTVCGGGLSPGGTALACDPVLRECGVPCSSTADCGGAGLRGSVCDQRPLSSVGGGAFAGDRDPYGYCVNPTC